MKYITRAITKIHEINSARAPIDLVCPRFWIYRMKWSELVMMIEGLSMKNIVQREHYINTKPTEKIVGFVIFRERIGKESCIATKRVEMAKLSDF
jgi:hypothetical protein